jgi:hypothetical protein
MPPAEVFGGKWKMGGPDWLYTAHEIATVRSADYCHACKMLLFLKHAGFVVC